MSASKRYGIGATAICGECGELISYVGVPAAEGELWIHSATNHPFCYPRGKQMAWPDSAPDTPAILGFQVQCAICPQRALLAVQLDGWVCPRCAEVVPTAADEHRACAQCGDMVEVGLSSREWCDGCEALAEELAAAMGAPSTAVVEGIVGRFSFGEHFAGLSLPSDDDDYPISKVVG